MMFKSIIIIVLIYMAIECNSIHSNPGNRINMELAMAKYDIVPNVIAEGPEKSIEILYLSGARVKAGNELYPVQMNEQPLVSWKADPFKYYTLIMFDPDAPTRDNPKYAHFLSWIVINIPGNRLEQGETICEYIGAIPPPNTGLHRFIFLIYQQKGYQQLEQQQSYISAFNYSARKSFSLRKFVQKYYLGKPIAGNFFLAEWDEYVEVIKNQFEE